ncbi:division/cell wall cluster transcriptional repressor MraZ [Bifidobacterium sp. ESL0784]|uniref:division/cell wall cluster transcriptional repressor MraZ n=1 Tax=Bifidobacterium sp. ESL0784 TaxID=2983231 RepID=UPI0023F655C6|nr:division/cell wall cluster transcriptional repressor MraZ [Bifidobacterium sp. ESL0784]MDF7641200.1 division/cell wall cluster transcriptional repressor MraZ [Bifidobacterium sp. ESL0784]
MNINPSNPATSSIQTSDAANGAVSASPAPEPLLLGTYTPKIDQKGRMALPAKMRAQLGTGMVMARGQEKCVYLLPQTEFRRIAARIQRASMGNKATRSYLRVFLSGAVEGEPDKQGRVLVPQNLRSYAGLGNDIVVIGVGTRAEIWNKESWDAYLADQEEGYSDIADDVLPAVEW